MLRPHPDKDPDVLNGTFTVKQSARDTAMSSPVDPHLENVKPITDAIEKQSRSSIRRLSSALGNGTRFVWHAWLGTAASLEEAVVDLSRELARKGEAFEANTKSELSERARRARLAAAKLSKKRIESIETKFGGAFHRPLHLLGAPSRRDVIELQAMAEEMLAAIAELSRQTALSRSKKQTPGSKGNGAKNASS